MNQEIRTQRPQVRMDYISFIVLIINWLYILSSDIYDYGPSSFLFVLSSIALFAPFMTEGPLLRYTAILALIFLILISMVFFLTTMGAFSTIRESQNGYFAISDNSILGSYIIPVPIKQIHLFIGASIGILFTALHLMYIYTKHKNKASALSALSRSPIQQLKQDISKNRNEDSIASTLSALAEEPYQQLESKMEENDIDNIKTSKLPIVKEEPKQKIKPTELSKSENDRKSSHCKKIRITIEISGRILRFKNPYTLTRGVQIAKGRVTRMYFRRRHRK